MVIKICLVGTESTGKTTLVKKLAEHYHTDYVPEMAREIIEGTEFCTEDHLMQIAELHAKTIREKTKTANKILFIDTDLVVTQSYSQYLFGKEMVVADWIEKENKFDLYLYLENDAPFVQDGTRLEIAERNKLNDSHKKELAKRNLSYQLITGNYEERFENAVRIIDSFLKNK